jgi:hypothetical protein
VIPADYSEMKYSGRRFARENELPFVDKIMA